MNHAKLILWGVEILFPLTLLLSNPEPFPEPIHPQEIKSILPELEPDQQRALQFIYNLGPYEPDHFSGLTHSDFYVVAGSREIADVCFTLLENDRFQNYWTEVFHALGIMASVEPERVDFDTLTKGVRRLEESDLSVDIVMNSLQSGYTAVARFGADRAEAFLVPRMRGPFWENQTRLEQNWASAGQSPRMVTPRDLAIRSFGVLGEEDAVTRLQDRLSDELDRGDTVVENGINVVEGNFHLRRRAHERRLQTYREWQNRKSESEESESGFPTDERSLDEEEDRDEPEASDVPGNSEDPDSARSADTQWRLWMYAGVIVLAGVVALLFLRRLRKSRAG